MRARDFMATVMVTALAVTAIGCGREPQVTREDVVAACMTFQETVGTRFGECLGWDEQMIADYIAANQEDCEGDVKWDTCWQIQERTYGSCEDRTAGDSCDELCPNGNCRASCPYVCPDQY